MNLDAQEAALGLLSMGYNYLSQPTPSTSSATLNSILTTTASPLIPQKRKQSDIDQQDSTSNHLQLVQQQQHHSYFRLTHSPIAEPSPPPRSNGAESNDGDPNETSNEAVDCICGFAVDDGFSIACDECSRWCHSACFGIAPGSVPEKFACWTCKPRSAVDKERAVRLQREKLGMADGEGKEAKQRRRSSPGMERKQRRGPNAAAVTASVDGAGSGKRKRRLSIIQQPPTPTVIQTTPNGAPEDEQIDIDNEPWREYYFHVVEDIIPNDDTRAKLRHQAAHWRGVTAISPSPHSPTLVSSSSLESPPPVSIKPLSAQSSLNPFLFQNSNPLVLPPAFSLHTTQAISSQSFITPFRSCITPSSTYLADPLNAYAHLGMPKPFVHLLGPPLDVALDARIVGNHGRFARWGCKPNAVLRPILCEHGSKETDDESTLGFGVFATRDMKANEEIILGWEWDDGNAIHLLPALLEAPDIFPLITSLSTNRPHKIQHIKNQMSNILHALSSTFTTCACGALSKDCALTQMAAFVDGHDLGSLLRRKDQSNEHDTAKIDIGPLVGKKRGFRTRERLPDSGGLGGMQMASDEDAPGNGRGFVWDGRRPYKGGILPSSLPSFVVSRLSPVPTTTDKEQALSIDEDMEMMDAPARADKNLELSKRLSVSIDKLVVPSPTPPSEFINNPPSEPRPPDPPDGGGDGNLMIGETEERMPPKMRKKWMHRELEARKEPSAKASQVTLDSQDQHSLMPPPPMPASINPTTVSSTCTIIGPLPNHTVCPSHRSPTSTPSTSTDLTVMSPPPSASGVSPLASFAQLSLLSPALNLESNQAESSEGSITVLSPPQAYSSRTIISPTGIEDGLTDNDGSITAPSPVLNSHATGYSRALSIYSRRHDEDDEVDYSPHSPEPSHNMDEQSSDLPLLRPQSSEPPEVTEFIFHPVLDNTGESCNDPETRPDNQATSSTPPPPISSPTSLLATNPTSHLTSTNSEPETEPSLKPSAKEQSPSQPLPKVKLTLKDFALRKKRQREEQALSQTHQTSPVTPSPFSEEEKETKSPTSLKTQIEPSGRDCVMVDVPHPVSASVSANNPEGTRHVTRDHVEVSSRSGFTLEIKSKENWTSRSDTTATHKEGENRMIQPSHSPVTSLSKPAPDTLTNGHLRVPPSYNLPNRPPPHLLPSRSIQQCPTINIQDMKQEVIETLVPSLLQRVSGIERSVSPIGPDPVPAVVNRISQEEEGEIGETPVHLDSRESCDPSSKRDPNNPQQLSLRNGPPTAPRFYLNPPTSPSLRPTPPSTSPIPSTTPNNTNGNRPNLPTAPRAFRQSMLHRSGSGLPAASYLPSLSVMCQNNAPGPFIPRGPSADRDKERDRVDWEQRHYRAQPRRGAGSGRGAPWGR